MSTVIRYSCFAVLVLFALVLTAVCGELACESFVHACCGRVDRAERIQSRVATVLARVFAAPSDGLTIASIPTSCGALASAPFSATSLASVSLRV